jgi:hypothetical protein
MLMNGIHEEGVGRAGMNGIFGRQKFFPYGS